jgi:predicted secreted hydrolase
MSPDFIQRMNSSKQLALATLALLALLLTACVAAPTPAPLDSPLPTPDVSGFARVTGPQPFELPDALGPHPDYQTEWWYYTGILRTDEGRTFGYQLTFFRRAMTPPDSLPERASDWATNDVYMAHFALSDVKDGQFQAHQRYARGAAGLAGAQADPYRVWLYDWSVEEVDDGVYRLRASQEDLTLDLTLTDERGIVLQGEEGYSPKGPEPGNASIYYSQPRLQSQGTVDVDGQRFDVAGLSWMDHEYGTSALGPDLVGWDWFGLHLGDAGELMLFQLRRADGGVDPFSSGAYIPPDGPPIQLGADDFTLTTLETWTSPHSGARYPARWRLRIPAIGLDVEISPLLADQELNLSYAYWEGAVSVEGEKDGQPLSGEGYMELSGYAESMAGQF